VLRDATIEADSIRGRQADAFGAFRSARVAIPRAEVDSFRIQPPDRENWFGAGVVAGLLGGIAVTVAVFRGAAGY
jgi:hypothetical protein